MNEPFRFIGLRLLENSNEKFLKNLKKGRVYKFYSDFSFLTENGDEVERSNQDIYKFSGDISFPEDLYKTNCKSGDIDVNISALVGKNGSGKSSLLEISISFVLYWEVGLNYCQILILSMLIKH